MIARSVVTLPELRRQRLRAALTQQQLAERAGVLRATIARLEHGGDTRLTTVRKLADALKCEPHELLGDDIDS